MQPLRGGIRLLGTHALRSSNNVNLNATTKGVSGFTAFDRNSEVSANGYFGDFIKSRFFGALACFSQSKIASRTELSVPFTYRSMTTANSASQDSSASDLSVPPRIKFKRPDKTARHIMQILDKEAVEEVKSQREIPDIRPGQIVQLKVEVPENKRRVSILKGIVIARRNAGLNSTFRIRRLVAGVGVESLFPLYSPNLKEIKILDQKKVRRAKLYYLRDKMNALKKQ